MFFDTHCHPYLDDKKPSSEVFYNFINNYGSYLTSIGIDLETSERSVELAKRFHFIKASVGIHPEDSKKFAGKLEETMQTIENMIGKNRDHVV